MKKSYDSPTPLCWYHSPEFHEQRLKNAAAGRAAQAQKRRAPVLILDELEKGAAECDRNRAEYLAAEEARKREWDKRGWSLVHTMLGGFTRLPCDKPNCFCHPKLPEKVDRVTLELTK